MLAKNKTIWNRVILFVTSMDKAVRDIAVLLPAIIVVGACVSSSAKADYIFGTPSNLGPTVNSASLEACPRVSPDGLTLYFCSQRPGGHGGTDIWVTTRETTSTDWGTPTNLGAPVNSTYEEVFPELWNDGLTLYFASNRPGAMAG